jgi:hypothetical protein
VKGVRVTYAEVEANILRTFGNLTLHMIDVRHAR